MVAPGKVVEKTGIILYSITLLNFDEQRLKLIIQRHFKYSKSLKAKQILDNWDFYIRKFIKVVPMDFEKALINMESEQSKKKFKRKVVGE